MKIIAMLFAIILLIILILFVVSDIVNTIKYIVSKKCDGYIVEVLDIEKIASYGRNQYRRFRRYKIEYNGGIESEILMARKKLNVGDTIKVHYSENADGSYNVLDIISCLRITELVLSTIIVIILIKVVIFVEMNGGIK